MRWGVVVVLVACAPLVPREPPLPTPRVHEAAAVTLNETCVGCHEVQAAAWRGSRHQRAYDNEAFQKALVAEPTAFCRGCHAPEANAETPTVATDLGVACVTCHVPTEGTVLAGSTRSGQAPHAITRSPTFGTASCASCHEFAFPGSAGDARDGAFMQTTMREHAGVRGERGVEAGHTATGCLDCHTSHSFSEVRDPAWLAKQLRVEVVRNGEVVRVTLTQTAPGHAFPTGDLFRRLAVRVGGETRYLARHFELGRTLTRDDRVFAEPRVVELPCPPGATPWSVSLERVLGVTGSDPAGATVESSVMLHQGVLP